MTETESTQLRDVKLSLNVVAGQVTPKWSVVVNKTVVHGLSRDAKSYASCLAVYHALKRALNVIACDSWGYVSCNHCSVLVEEAPEIEIWYDDDEAGERVSYQANICADCKEALRVSGGLKE